MAKPRLSKAAVDDLRSIRHYSKAVFGASIARASIDGLRAALDGLGHRPMAGIAERQLGADLRSVGFRSHRVYFETDGVKVLIVRILHHAQNAPPNLSRH